MIMVTFCEWTDDRCHCSSQVLMSCSATGVREEAGVRFIDYLPFWDYAMHLSMH